MQGSEVSTLYKCVVCSYATDKIQALRAHMKKHKGEGYRRTSIVVHGERWDSFKGLADRHHTTTCQLIDALVKAAIKGDEQGLTIIGSSNPFLIQVNEFRLGAPRGRFSHVAADVGLSRIRDLAPQKWPPNCPNSALYKPVGRLVWCREKEEEVPVDACHACFRGR
jgi:hypothetical protein